MKILIIGGTGHMGSHLTPILVSQGHSVYIATRGNKPTIGEDFRGAEFITCDASDENSLNQVANSYKFDAVVDFPGTGFTTWNVFKNKVSHIVVCGSLWMFGRPNVVPTPEITQSECPFPNYAKRYAEIEKMRSESGKYKAVFTAIMPPNICGPGKIPLDTSGGRSIDVHRAVVNGATVYLPDGPETLISPCDAYDLAMLFALALNQREAAAGEIFNGGSNYAMPVTQFVKTYGKIYNVEIPIKYVPWEEYKAKINPSIGAWWHFYSHMCPDISKSKRLLGYEPKYTPEQAMERAVEWMKEQGIL